MNEKFHSKTWWVSNFTFLSKTTIIYDGTVYFTKRFISKFDRTVDQMIQAARSGKQNIAEASVASEHLKNLKSN